MKYGGVRPRHVYLIAPFSSELGSVNPGIQRNSPYRTMFGSSSRLKLPGSPIHHRTLPVDDLLRRLPDISKDGEKGRVLFPISVSNLLRLLSENS